MSRHLTGFIAFIILGAAVLVGLYFALPHLTKLTQLSSSDAQKAEKLLRIGTDSWAGYIPLCSKELRRRMHGAGYLLQCIDDGADYPARMKKLRKGEIDLAVATVDSFLLNGAKENFPATIIMVIDESKGGDAIVAHKDSVPSLEALKAQPDTRIAFTPNSPSEHLLKSIAVHFDIPSLRGNRGAWRVPVSGSAEALKQLQSGKVAAAALWEPDVSKALGLPQIHKLLGTENTAGLIVDVLLANRDYAKNHPEGVRLLLANYFRTLKYFRDNPDALAEEIKSATHLSSAQATTMLKGIAWVNLTDNARQWFGVAGAGAAREGVINALESTAEVLVDSGDFRESPIPDRDPYRLQYRAFIEDLYLNGVGITETADSAGIKTFLPLDPKQWDALAEVGTLKIRPIGFQSGTDELSLEGKQELDRAAQALAHFPNFRVIVKGHTSTRGDAEANQRLSLERAAAVRRYLLVTHGIDEARLRAVGLGGSQPLSPQPGESERAYQYRLPRVELYLVAESY